MIRMLNLGPEELSTRARAFSQVFHLENLTLRTLHAREGFQVRHLANLMSLKYSPRARGLSDMRVTQAVGKAVLSTRAWAFSDQTSSIHVL